MTLPINSTGPVGRSETFLPNTAGPIQRAMAADYAARRKRLFMSPLPKSPVHIPPPAPAMPVPEVLLDITDDAVLDSQRATVRGVIRAVCTKHQVSRTELLSMSRQTRIIRCRQECCYELRRTIKIAGRPISLPEIGRYLGGIDHTTVLHSIRKHTKLISTLSPVSTSIPKQGD